MTTLSPSVKTRTSSHSRWTFWLMLLLLLLSLMVGRHWLTPALAAPFGGVNVTDRVAATFSGLRLNRATGTFDSVATLKNVSTEPVLVPLSLVITGITPSSVTLGVCLT